MKGRRRGHVLATILYTDIVGSSRLAAELGDRRWRVLLARHHLIVRKELKRHRGREIDNAGDGFLASFDDQEQAIRCACAIVEAVRVLGIEVRAGLHVGQAEVLGRKLGGIVVNAGARVMSEAGPGQILVTRVLKDLMPGSGFLFQRVAERELKGIDGRWALYAVTAVEGKRLPPPLEQAEAAARIGSIRPPPITRRRWGRVAIAALALAVVSGTILVVVSREPPIEITPNSLLRIDAETGEVVADIALTEGIGSVPVEVPQSELWVLGLRSQALSVVDVKSNTVRVYGAPRQPDGYGLAYLDGSLWMTASNDTVVRFSPSTRLVQKEIRLRPPHGEDLNIAVMAAGFGRLWVAAHDALRVFAIDPETNEAVDWASTDAGLNGIAAGKDFVWVPNYSSGTVSRIDPVTRRSFRIEVGARGMVGSNSYFRTGGPSDIDFGFDAVWVTDAKLGVVYRIEPATGKVEGTIHVGPGSANKTAVSGIAVLGKSVWVSTPGNNAIVRIDPATNRAERVMKLPYVLQDVLAADGDIWVLVAE